jgi:hypothetical protein
MFGPILESGVAAAKHVRGSDRKNASVKRKDAKIGTNRLLAKVIVTFTRPDKPYALQALSSKAEAETNVMDGWR